MSCFVLLLVSNGDSGVHNLVGLGKAGSRMSSCEYLGDDDSLPQIKNPICHHRHWKPSKHKEAFHLCSLGTSFD